MDRIKDLENSKIQSAPKITKTYFKLAKTLALQGCKESQELMVKSQYDRTKDLTNITQNISC